MNPQVIALEHDENHQSSFLCMVISSSSLIENLGVVII